MTHPDDVDAEDINEDEFFGDEEDDIPDFLDGEDIVEIE